MRLDRRLEGWTIGVWRRKWVIDLDFPLFTFRLNLGIQETI